MRCFFIPVVMCLALPAWADEVPEGFLRAFNQRAREAEAILETQGAAAAITHYEQALLGELSGYGRVHLRLAQLHQREGEMVAAAHHFRSCDADERVDAMDREVICQAGLRATTAPVTLDGLPDGTQVVIVEPTLFAGPLRSGQRVPLGSLKLVVLTPGEPPREVVRRVEGPLTWPLTSAAVVARQPTPLPAEVIDLHEESRETGGMTWPAWVVGGTGAALVGVGLYLGFDNQGELDDIRARQRAGRCPGACRGDLRASESAAQRADGLWMGGVAVLASAAVVAWLLAEDGPPP